MFHEPCIRKSVSKSGIDSADQLTESTHDKVLATVHDNLTRELAVEWREYMETNEAYSPPDQEE